MWTVGSVQLRKWLPTAECYPLSEFSLSSSTQTDTNFHKGCPTSCPNPHQIVVMVMAASLKES